MRSTDTSIALTVLYVLALLFLGALYLQGDIMAEPGALKTLEAAALGGASGQHLMAGFKLSDGSALTTAITLTVFFSIAWVMNRSRSN